MKKRKIVLGFAMAAMAALSLSACDDASVNAPATSIVETGENAGNESKYAISGKN